MVSRFTLSNVFSISFVWIYQYAGSPFAIFKTNSGKYSAGTKAPHKKADPRATTFTIPFTAFLFLTNVVITKAMVKQQKVNSKELIM